MQGRKLTLRIKSKLPLPSLELGQEGKVDPRSGIESELLIDNMKIGLVQQLVLGVSADDLVPVVFLKLIPQELDIEIESPAVFHAALAEYKGGIMHTLDGSIHADPNAPPVFPPFPPFPPLPPLGELDPVALKGQWQQHFPPIDEVAARMAAVPPPVMAPAYHGDRGPAPTPGAVGFAALDELVKQKGAGQPVVIEIRDGRALEKTPADYEAKSKGEAAKG